MQQLNGIGRDRDRQPGTIGVSERLLATIWDSEIYAATLCDQRDSEGQPEMIEDGKRHVETQWYLETKWETATIRDNKRHAET